MINCIWGLKQLWLQVNCHALFHLHGIQWAVRNRLRLKNSKWKYMSPAGFREIVYTCSPMAKQLCHGTSKYLLVSCLNFPYYLSPNPLTTSLPQLRQLREYPYRLLTIAIITSFRTFSKSSINIASIKSHFRRNATKAGNIYILYIVINIKHT